MGLFKQFKKLVGDERGNALAIGAAAMPLVIAGAGMALDTVQISLAKRQLQRSADSAAMAGAFSVGQSRTALDGVTRDLQVNNEVTLSEAATVENAPASGPFAGDNRAIRVRLTTNRSLSFLSFFGADQQRITVEATARIVLQGDFCMLSLEDGTTAGVTIGGNATINLGCGITSNSRAAEAITASGSSSITASPIMAVGGVPNSSNFTSGTQLIPYAAMQADPFAGIPVPAPTNCRAAPATGPHADVTINESTLGYNATDRSICYNGWDVKGTVNISFAEPTIIYINGSELNFSSQANLTADNVTFVLTSTNATSNPASIARLSMNGQAEVTINSPTTGPFTGVAMYEDRRAPLGRTIRFNGGSGTTLEGALYFPQAYFEYNGGADMAATCLQLVARRLDFRGNGSIGNECNGTPGRRNFEATYVRLVG